MANNPSAIKRIRQNERRKDRNRSNRSTMRSIIKDVREAAAEGDAAKAAETLPKAIKTIDQTAQKGIIHPNAAARTKSRLTKLVSGLSA